MPPKLYLVFDYMDFDLKQCLDSDFPRGMYATAFAKARFFTTLPASSSACRQQASFGLDLTAPTSTFGRHASAAHPVVHVPNSFGPRLLPRTTGMPILAARVATHPNHCTWQNSHMAPSPSYPAPSTIAT